MNQPLPFIQGAARLRSTRDQETLDNITVSKTDLLRILKENLEAHNEVFNASTQAYYETLRAELEGKKSLCNTLATVFQSKLEAVTTTEPAKGLDQFYSLLKISAKKPTSYEGFYTAAIRKVELSQRDEFNLDDGDFQRYILNNWEWKNDFVNTATSYLGASESISGAIFTGLNKFNK